MDDCNIKKSLKKRSKLTKIFYKKRQRKPDREKVYPISELARLS